MRFNYSEEDFADLGIGELVDLLNAQVGVPGWTSSRAQYLGCLTQAIERSSFDHTPVINYRRGFASLSLKKRVKIDWVECRLVWEE